MANEFDIDDLFFGEVIAKAELMATLTILDDLCRQIGYRDPEGLSLRDRFYKQRYDQLDLIFQSLEDGNPTLAERLRERFADAMTWQGDATDQSDATDHNAHACQPCSPGLG